MWRLIFIAGLVYALVPSAGDEARKSKAHFSETQVRSALKHCCSDLPDEKCCLDAINKRKPLKCGLQNRTQHEEKANCISRALFKTSTLDLINASDSPCCDLEGSLQHKGSWSRLCYNLVNTPAQSPFIKLRKIKKAMNNSGVFDCFLKCQDYRRYTYKPSNTSDFKFPAVNLCNLHGMMSPRKAYISKERADLYQTEPPNTDSNIESFLNSHPAFHPPQDSNPIFDATQNIDPNPSLKKYIVPVRNQNLTESVTS